MTAPLSALSLARDGWQRGLAAAMPNLAWLGLLALAGGAYSWAINSAALNPYLDFAILLIAFGVGVAFSWRLYSTLLGPRSLSVKVTETKANAHLLVPLFGFIPVVFYYFLGVISGWALWLFGHRDPRDRASVAQLAHANSAVYLAFVFIGFFVGFFLLILPGILIEAQGKYELDGDAAPELLRQAFLDMLPTAYGAVYLLIAAVGAWILSFFALRLTLFGAATFDQGKALVFQTFPWTRNHLRMLGLAALITHVAPFAAGLAANAGLRALLPETMAGHFIEGAAGIVLFTPFLLAGHGMAAAAYGALKPADAPGSSVPG